MEYAQAYIRFQFEDFDESVLRSKLRGLEMELVSICKDIYGPGFEVDVQFEEGSLIGRITALSAVSAVVLQLLGNYSNIKAGAEELIDDLKIEQLYDKSMDFSDAVIDSVINSFDLSTYEIIRKERRRRDTNYLITIVKSLPAGQKKANIQDLSYALVRLYSKDESKRDAEIIFEKLPAPVKSRLPETLPDLIREARRSASGAQMPGGRPDALSYQLTSSMEYISSPKRAGRMRDRRFSYHNRIKVR